MSAVKGGSLCRRWIGLLATMCVLGACGSTHMSTGSTSAKPTPTVKEAAASEYLAAATTYNAAIDAASKLCPGATDTNAQLAACYSGYYKADQAFQQAVFAIRFPPGMTADVDALITACSLQTQADYGIATSPDPNGDYSGIAADNTAAANASAAASVVRHDLGLPPVPVGTLPPTPTPT